MLKKYVLPSFALLLLTSGIIFYLVRDSNSTPELPKPPLKELADKHGIAIGNHAIGNRIGEKAYDEILSSEFDFVLADNQPNWSFTDHDLRPSRTGYDYAKLDPIFEYAEARNMPVEAHHFVWGEEKWLPTWLKEGNYSKEELDSIIKDHIYTVGTRYKGRAQSWTVVNEAFTRGQNIYGLRDWWADNTGSKDYIEKSFRWARETDPNAKLILNDFGNEGINDVSNEMYEYIKDAKSRGVPIDALGMQMHIDGVHPPTKDEVISNMKRFGELGVRIYVTEFDVNMNDLPANGEAKDKTAARIYYEMMRACIESEYCDSFAILGITDKEHWYNHMGLPDPRPLPFDREYDPKPAYFSLRDALMQD